MSLQWTAVALYLYAEIAFVLLLLLPWIRPNMWNKFFRSRFVKAIESFSHIYGIAILGVLALLFFDAIREVRKYTGADEEYQNMVHTANADAVIHMRLFRAQRNLYISGFALFLALVIKRMIGLISHEAQLMATAEAAMKQAKSASDAASTMLGSESDAVNKLQNELDKTKTLLKTAQADRDAMKEQSENLQKEYDRLSTQLNELERKGSDKKED